MNLKTITSVDDFIEQCGFINQGDRMSKQTMTKSQLREAINGLGPLAPDWLVEALEDFIELQESHETLLAMHAEDAYHLDEARAKLQALEVVSKTTDTIVPDAKDEIDHDGIWTNSDVAEQRYIQGWNDCRAEVLRLNEVK